MSLPSQPTPFIGRAAEVESLLGLLKGRDPRLLTVTGPPGVGKTRLAIEIAHRLDGTFEHGIHFVNLGPLKDADLVPLAIVQAVGLQGRRLKSGSASAAPSQLAQHLRHKHTLLVLDNFEHVRSAGISTSNLLTSCPNLKILVTSREALRISWEREYHLSPFPVPSLQGNSAVEFLEKEPAIALFIDRARAVSPDFTLTQANVASVVEICRRLDALPLAIELAAGRIRTFSPQDLASHLAHRFEVLISRRVDSHDRHRSLYDSIAWSYQLLGQREQAFFRRLSVFRGGFTVDGASAVIHPVTRAELLDALSSIIEKNLVTAIHGKRGTTRYVFLESIREFAAQELETAGEAENAQSAHAAYFLALADEADLACNGPDQTTWMDRIEDELGNFRAALHWHLEHQPIEALRLAVGLQWFWEERGYFIESHRWYTTCLEKARDAPTGLKARALASQGVSLAYMSMEDSIHASLHGLELARASGDHLAEALCLSNLGLVVLIQGNYVQADQYYRERLSLHERHGPVWGVASALTQMAALARMQGDLARAAELATRNLEISRPLGIKREVALGLGTLGWIALHRGELSRATELFEEGLAINRELGALPRVARNLRGLGVTAFRQGDLSRARRLAVESVRLSEKIGSKADVVETISSLCGLLIAASDSPSAARWLGFTHAARDTGMLVTFGVDRADVDRLTETVRERLGDTAFDRAWNEGRLLSTEQVIREIESSFAEMAAAASTKEPYPLSPREREVAALIAEGLSNANIAARLHIGVRTAETHVQSIMNKLALHSRAQIATWVSKRLSH